MTTRSIHFVHIPKTAGSSLWADLCQKIPKNNVGLIDIYQESREQCKVWAPELAKHRARWPVEIINAAKEIDYAMTAALTKDYFETNKAATDNKTYHQLLHYHTAGNPRLVKSVVRDNCQTNEHAILFSLREPIARTVSHINSLYSDSERIIDVNLAEALYLNSCFTDEWVGDLLKELHNKLDIDRFRRKLSSREINSLNFLKLYQIRWLLSYLICDDFNDRSKVLFEMSPTEVEHLFLEAKHLLASDNVHFFFLDSNGEKFFNSKFQKVLDLVGIHDYRLDSHHQGTKTVKHISNVQFSQMLDNEFRYWLNRENKIIRMLLDQDA